MKRSYLFVLFITILYLKISAQTENNLSQTEKLYGLSVIWKEAAYNFAFFDQIPNVNWDSCYQVFVPKVMETKADWDYYPLLEKS